MSFGQFKARRETANPVGKQPRHEPLRRNRNTALAKPKPIRRFGPLSKSEKGLIESVVVDSPREISKAQTKSLAVALRRSPAAMVQAIENARQKLVERAGRYADIHLEAAESALKTDPDVARKASEWALQALTAKDERGQTHRIVDQPKSEQPGSGIVVQIGFALGGMKATAPKQLTTSEVIDAE